MEQPKTEMVGCFWRRVGKLSSSHPWEVIIGGISVIIFIVSRDALHNSTSSIQGWNKKDGQNSEDSIIIALTRLVAISYIYIQFRSLKHRASKYILGIVSTFLLVSCGIFSLVLYFVFNVDFTALNKALPFFLLLFDLNKTSAFARFALCSRSQGEVSINLAHGMSILGPSLTLDSLVEGLLIAVGTISGVNFFETMSSFSSFSILINYVLFLTIYPAVIALVLEMVLAECANRSVPVWYIPRPTPAQENRIGGFDNPVTQRVKAIMSAGLLLVHAHNWFLSSVGVDSSSIKLPISELAHNIGEYINPHLPLWKFHATQFLSPELDFLLTLSLVIILALKYIVYDEDDFDRCQSPIQTPPPRCDSPITNLPPPCTVSESCLSEKLTTLSPDDQNLRDKTAQRSVEACRKIMNEKGGSTSDLLDSEVEALVSEGHLSAYSLEKSLGDTERAVTIRRSLLSKSLNDSEAMDDIPFLSYDYSKVYGACCENVVGYASLPIGVAGPLLLDNKLFHVPMATTEGCLVASTNRGCRALTLSGGVSSNITKDAMTRAPLLRFRNAREASEAKLWLQSAETFKKMEQEFNSTSRFARLKRLLVVQAARFLYVRFEASTGDAMGMNMITKGCEKALLTVQKQFPSVKIMSLSSNFCTDKKPSAINWIGGRGKSVTCEAVLPPSIVEKVLKTNVRSLVELNIAKNLVGSAMAGTIGGFNAHAANALTALFIATGQDTAQCCTSSSCIVVMEETRCECHDSLPGSEPEQSSDLTCHCVHPAGHLYISCTMPSIEVGTVGGGTILPSQSACLKMLGLHGPSDNNEEEHSSNAACLARVVCATVLASELSLMSVHTSGHLNSSHMRLNRKKNQENSSSEKNQSKSHLKTDKVE